MNTLSKLAVLALTVVLAIGCRSDIRTKYVKSEQQSPSSEAKGKALLDAAWKAQGLDKLNNHKVYSFHGHDVWRGVLGSVGKVWPGKDIHMDFKYEIGSFDGQVKYQSGKKKGHINGLQNWKYYEIESDTNFTKPNSRVQFGLTAFQYFVEMVDRLRQAPIIVYAGEDEFKGKSYDLVFCTWNTLKPHKEADQYIAWINKETGLIDYTQYTIRENYLHMPGAHIFYGGVEFANLKSVDGILIPHTQIIYAFNLKTKEKRNIHKLEVSDFKFDSFPVQDLKLDNTLGKSGDFKP